MSNIFEKASRKAIRFETVRGTVSHEDLWEMKLQSNDGFNLDDIAKGINRQLKDSDEESFVSETSSANAELRLKLDLVKHVIKYKKDMADRNQKAKRSKDTNDKIKAIIESKKDQELQNKSVEELEKMLEE